MMRDPIDERKNIDRPITRLSLPKAMLSDECAIKDCVNRDIQVHDIRALKRRVHGYVIESIESKKKRPRAVMSALARKQIPLCKYHHKEWHMNRVGLNSLRDKYVDKKIRSNIK